MRIVGWYQGNERADDTTLPERAIKAAETIKKNNDDKAIIFLVNLLLPQKIENTNNSRAFIIVEQ